MSDRANTPMRPLPTITPPVGNFVSIYRPVAEKSSPTTAKRVGDVGRPGGGDNETVRFIAGDFLEESIYDAP